MGPRPTTLLAPTPLAGTSAAAGARHTLALLLAFAMAGCGAETQGDGGGGGQGGEAEACLPPSRVVDGACREPGIQDDGCPAGSWLASDGHCEPAGIPPEMCAQGFVPTEQRGCEPVLPAGTCPPGTMALPGDTECHEVMPCADGRWGDIPIDPTTVYVDQSYDQGAGPSDGSEGRPYRTVGEAVAAASPGALVAIAAGSYVEEVSLEDKPLRLWGKCPAEVELVGVGDLLATVEIRTSGCELAGLAIRGPIMGVVVTNAEDLELHGLWVHDNAARGIGIEDTLGPTSATVSSSLIEQNHLVGVFVGGAVVELDGVVLRGNLPRDSDQAGGRGVSVQGNPTTGTRSSVWVHDSLIELNHELGVFVAGSDFGLEASVVRGTLPRATDQLVGCGMSIQDSTLTEARSDVTVRTSLIEDNHEVGVSVFGSDVEIEGITVRRSLPRASDQTSGRGLSIQVAGDTGARSDVTVRTSLIEDNQGGGVFVGGGDALLEAVVIRGTLPQASDQTFGRGLNIQSDVENGERASATLRALLIDHNHEMGLTVLGSDAQLLGVSIVNTSARPLDDLYGDGILSGAGENTTVELVSCNIGENDRAGLGVFGATATLRDSALSCNTFHLATEMFEGRSSVLTDAGGNRCSCGEEQELCSAVSVGLEPPEPMVPLE